MQGRDKLHPSPTAANVLKQLRRQVAKRQKGSLELMGAGCFAPVIDLVPPSSDK